MDYEKIIDDCLKIGNDGSAWNIKNWDNARTYIREAIYASQRDDGLCANCGESKTLVVCKECLNELVANR